MPRPTTRPTAITALGLAGILVLSACGGTDTPPAEADSPLTAFYESISGDLSPEAQEKKFEEQNRKAEELIAECMAEEGFEYIPNIQNGASFSMSDEEFDAAKYAAENGYGMSIMQEMSPEQTAEMEAYVDPNQEYVAAMSETESAAYGLALSGDPAIWDVGPDGENPNPTPEEMGCQGTANDEASGGMSALNESEDVKAFDEIMTIHWESITKDPRLVEATSKWSDCMADAGYDYKLLEEPSNHFMEQSNALYSEENPDGPDEATLTELQDLERETAVTDNTCREKVKYDDIYRTVQFDLEQKIVDENKDLLDRVAAAYKEFAK